MKAALPRHKSDCMASVLASLLELPIEEMPDFWRDGNIRPGTQYESVRRWLADQGFHWYYCGDVTPRQMKAFRIERREFGCSWPPRGYWVGQVSRVEWLRDGDPSHVVVMKNHRCVFNPSGTTAETLEDDVWLIGYYLLIPLDPSLGVSVH